MDSIFIQTNAGEGVANYIAFNRVWYSVNGTPENLTEIRWKVTDKKVITRLNLLVTQQTYREMLSD